MKFIKEFLVFCLQFLVSSCLFLCVYIPSVALDFVFVLKHFTLSVLCVFSSVSVFYPVFVSV